MAVFFRQFLRNEDGAATSEFVVLAAGVVALAVPVVMSLTDGTKVLADNTSTSIINVSFQPNTENAEAEPIIESALEVVDVAETVTLPEEDQAIEVATIVEPPALEETNPEVTPIETEVAEVAEPVDQTQPRNARSWPSRTIAFLARIFGFA